ncbi:MAG: lipid-A-disaccharide synthase N-terminal domain-containing protein [Proteobacteria bacterium]|nr:lipid-A-disaccharide synthase N-terminal domain-containing protein [Pseudomonadota bacterium]
MSTEQIWIGVGLFGQLLFGSRMLIQWIASEREGRSIVPTIFWYISIAGGAVLLSYAIYRADPVFIIGQAAGSFVYIRNIYFIHREKQTR